MKFITYKKYLYRYRFRSEYKEFVKKYRKHPELFVEQILGIKLHWYQKLMLNNLGYFNLRFRNKSYIRIPKEIKRRNRRNNGFI